eukprot:503416-Amphidinium_carterae.2
MCDSKGFRTQKKNKTAKTDSYIAKFFSGPILSRIVHAHNRSRPKAMPIKQRSLLGDHMANPVNLKEGVGGKAKEVNAQTTRSTSFE